MARVFLYNVNDEEKRIKIQLAALRCGLKSVIVPPEDFSLPVGALLGEPGFAPPAGPGEGFEDELVESLALKEALDRLKPSEREIINLKIMGDLTFREISEVLQIPMGTVTWRYRSAVEKMRRFGYE